MKTITFVGGPHHGKTLNVDDNVSRVAVTSGPAIRFYDTDMVGDPNQVGYVGEFYSDVLGALKIPETSLV